jgi:signal transduction histidine kinase
VERAGIIGKWRKTALARYGVSAASVVICTAIRMAADPILGSQHGYTFYFAAIAISAWFSGFWPAVVATILSYLAADWFFIPPRHAFDFHNFTADDFLSLGGFLFSALAIAFSIRAVESERRRVEARGEELAREIVERERIQQQLETVQQALREHAINLEERVEERTANLRQTIQSLEAVCYHIAHDLRGPLRAMQGFTTILVNDYAANLDAKGEDYARRVGEAADRMDKLIQSLLDYGRLGHQEFSLHRVNLEAHVDALVSDLVQKRKTEAEIQVARPIPDVVANGFLIDQVINQLLTNAVTFVKPGVPPRVAVWAEKHNSTVRLVVEDNGIGIPPEYQSKIFQLFERLQPNEIVPGTGIGLALVFKAAQRMKGGVGVQSKPGNGSRFWIDLPASN